MHPICHHPSFPASSEFNSKAAAETLLEVLRDYFGSDQDFEDQVFPKGKPVHDEEQGRFYQRFIQKINNHVVEGASLVVHIDSNGDFVAVNGEFVEGKGLSMIATLTSKEALTEAINIQYKGLASTRPEVVGAAKLTVVRASKDGSACYAWKAPVQYVEEVVTLDNHATKRKLRQEYIFADAKNGEPCAVHPKVFGFGDSSLDNGHSHEAVKIPSSRRLTPGTPVIETYDCHQATDPGACSLVSNDATTISIVNDLAVEKAHNYAIATYNYYWDTFGRDSIDDNGMVRSPFSRLFYHIYFCFYVLGTYQHAILFSFVSLSVIEILCSLGFRIQ